MKTNTAFIVAGGKGTRMLPETQYTPKPMVDLAGRPLLEYHLDALPKEITKVFLGVGHLAQVITDHFGRSYNGRTIEYVHQPEALGTADMLRRWHGTAPEWFVFGFADDLQDKDAIVRMCQGDTMAMLASRTDHPENFGVLETDVDDYLLRIHEKSKHPPGNLVSTGMFLLHRDIYNFKPSVVGNNWELSHTGLLQECADVGKKIKVIETVRWFPISTLEDRDAAKKVLHEFL